MSKFAIKIAKLKRKLGFKYHTVFLSNATTEEELLMLVADLQVQGFKVGHYVYEPQNYVVALRLDLKK